MIIVYISTVQISNNKNCHVLKYPNINQDKKCVGKTLFVH